MAAGVVRSICSDSLRDMPDPEIATVNVLMIVSLAEKPASKALTAGVLSNPRGAKKGATFPAITESMLDSGEAAGKKRKSYVSSTHIMSVTSNDDRESPDHEFPLHDV